MPTLIERRKVLRLSSPLSVNLMSLHYELTISKSDVANEMRKCLFAVASCILLTIHINVRAASSSRLVRSEERRVGKEV